MRSGKALLEALRVLRDHQEVAERGWALFGALRPDHHAAVEAAAGRGDEGFKEVYEKQIRSYLDLIAGLGEHSEEARSEAMLTLNALVGATLMSRAVADSGLSDELLTNVADQLKRHAAPAPAA
ncbi:hypothetical protein ABT288_37285 [Streptomyces sp. NPDC001093]|uniref:hypothetical protein n=1 Tax=Streptomyces sp. NPDC001093 TaxID=3154376 RepID=UPI003333894E